MLRKTICNGKFTAKQEKSYTEGSAEPYSKLRINVYMTFASKHRVCFSICLLMPLPCMLRAEPSNILFRRDPYQGPGKEGVVSSRQ